MKVSIEHFQKYVLPTLRQECAEPAGLKSAVGAFLRDNEVIDAEGEPVAVELLTADDRERPTAVDHESLDELVTKAVSLAVRELGRNGRGNPVARATASAAALPANVKRFGTLKHVRGEQADAKAYRFGMWCAAAAGQKFAADYCQRQGLVLTKAQSEGSNGAGGFLVPAEFDNLLVDLREQYGVFRRNARIVPMSADTKSVPRRAGGLTAYFVGEGSAITESAKSWNQVNLVAKKLGALAKYSNELSEDAIINIGDDLAGEIAWAFAQKEDQCGFTGDGTAPYGGIVGLGSAIAALHVTPVNIAGMVVSSGATYGAITAAEIATLMGRLPRYAYTPATRWYCSAAVWAGVLQRLAMAQGGATAMELLAGGRQPMFMGYPVEIVQVLPQVAAAAQVCLYFGDLSKAAMFGDRRATTIDISDSAMNAFEQDQIVLRGTSRFDINVHDVGNASAVAANRVPGPMVCLRLA